MDAELFIHGPRHAFYGKEEETQYCQLFDNSQIKDEIRFVVEIRKGSNGKWYTYYTYCRYGNVLDIDGRSGAYIGLTVRLDAYYANLRNLYTILDATFYAKVVGLLVKVSGNCFQYLVADFRNSQQSILNSVEKSIGSMLAGSIATSDIFPIDSSFATGGIEVVKGLDDNQYSMARMAEIKRTGRLVFASSNEIDKIVAINREFDSKQRELKVRMQQEVSQIQRNLDDANTKNMSLKDDVSKKERQIESLMHQKQQLQADIDMREEEKRELLASLDSVVLMQEDINQLKKQISQLKSEKNVLESKLNDLGSDIKHDSYESPRNQGHLPDRISNKWKFSELGEGLKIGIFAFFLIAIAAVVYCLFFAEKDVPTDTKTIKESNPIQEKISGEQVLTMPNELTDMMFPDCVDGTTSGKLCVKQFDLNSEINHYFKFQLESPSIMIDAYEWIVKDSESKICLKAETRHPYLDFSTEEKDSLYTVQIFIRDTLVVMKHFDLLNYEE